MNEALAAARSVRTHAYAPYSGYLVGAAAVGADGIIYTGCNVENISFGATLCAERVAIAKMVCAGCREIRELALVTLDGATPCGICRQTIAEFTRAFSDVRIYCENQAGELSLYTLQDLLPHSFSSSSIRTAHQP